MARGHRHRVPHRHHGARGPNMTARKTCGPGAPYPPSWPAAEPAIFCRPVLSATHRRTGARGPDMTARKTCGPGAPYPPSCPAAEPAIFCRPVPSATHRRTGARGPDMTARKTCGPGAPYPPSWPAAEPAIFFHPVPSAAHRVQVQGVLTWLHETRPGQAHHACATAARLARHRTLGTRQPHCQCAPSSQSFTIGSIR